MSRPRTLSQKIWDRHLVEIADAGADEPDLLYIDLHLVHEEIGRASCRERVLCVV